MHKEKYFINHSLKLFNTFKINVQAKKIIIVKYLDLLIHIIKKCEKHNTPYIILGEGSNTLFLENYLGIVIINRIKGIKFYEYKKYWILNIQSGEKWHDIVQYTLHLGILGLENLAFIPGCVGSAAIQNIGAYGLEFQDICSYVEIFCLKKNIIKRIQKKFCQFSYRNSLFKNQYNQKYFIISVGIKLKKAWQPKIFPYLQKKMNFHNINAYSIYNIIHKIRRKKLPNMKKLGNAGSFFINPTVTKKEAKKLISLYNAPFYICKNGFIKIYAGWLIENYPFVKLQIGDAAIHQKQKLILVNKKNATSQEIIKLARIIHEGILKKFNIYLEPEVNFIGSKGKIKSSMIFQKNRSLYKNRILY